MKRFKQTEIGEIPEEWEAKSIDDFAETKSGGTPSTVVKTYWLDGTIPWINSGELKDMKITKPTTHITLEASKNSAAKVFPKGSVVIALTGATTGKVGILTFDSAVNQSVTAIFPSKKHVPEYLFYYLMKERQTVLSHNVGAAQPHINKGIVDKLRVALPPLSEQQKIASVLSCVDSAIAETNEIIEKARTLKKGLMQELLTRGIGHKKFKETDIGGIPEEWEINSLENLAEIVGGSTPSTKQPEYWGGDFAFVTPTDVTSLDGRIYLEKTEKTLTEKGRSIISAKTIPVGSVLFTSRASVGFCAINALPVVTNQGFASFICKERIHNLFLFYLLGSMKTQFEQLGNGSTFLEVSRKSLKKTKIALPPLAEQRRIASVLTTADAKIESEVQKRSQFETLKKGLMQDLLTGKVRFPEFVKVS